MPGNRISPPPYHIKDINSEEWRRWFSLIKDSIDGIDSDAASTDTVVAEATQFSFTAQAGEKLSAYVPVYLTSSNQVRAASSSDITTRNVIGLTATSVNGGQDVEVITDGLIENSGWGWQKGEPVFVGEGRLTQTPPVEGYVLLFGFAADSDVITVHKEPSVELFGISEPPPPGPDPIDLVFDAANKASAVTLSPDKKSMTTPRTGLNGGLAKSIHTVSGGGKYYYEFVYTSNDSGASSMRVGGAEPSTPNGLAIGFTVNQFAYSTAGQVSVDNVHNTGYPTYTVGDVISVLLDLDTGAIAFWKNGVDIGAVSETIDTGVSWCMAAGTGLGATNGTNTYTMVLSDSEMTYSAPDGYDPISP